MTCVIVYTLAGENKAMNAWDISFKKRFLSNISLKYDVMAAFWDKKGLKAQNALAQW